MGSKSTWFGAGGTGSELGVKRYWMASRFSFQGLVSRSFGNYMLCFFPVENLRTQSHDISRRAAQVKSWRSRRQGFRVQGL